MHKKGLLKRLSGKPTDKLPLWMMRQAGRYLPEYKALRKQSEGFINFCLTPHLAAEATLQPLKRFDLDGVILFADILLVPYGMGQTVSFEQGEGPKLEALSCEKEINAFLGGLERLFPVFETIHRVKQALPPEASFIGFSGGLWTVACYMIQGQAEQGFGLAVHEAEKNTLFLTRLFDALEKATIDYLLGQIEAGVEILQIFESHAGLLQGDSFDRWVIEPTQRIVAAVKEKHPAVPIIGFPRGARIEEYQRFAQQTGVQVIGIDQNISCQEAKEKMSGKILQGNMDPQSLLEGGVRMEEEAQNIKKEWGDKHIFNLGHGILPQTPPEHVTQLIDIIRS